MKRLLATVLLFLVFALWTGCRPRATEVPAYEGESQVVEVSSTQQFDDTVAAQDVVLVDFWASWCYPCQVLKPTIAEISETYKGRVTVLSVDVDEQEALAKRFGIQSIPAIYIFHQGKQVKSLVGALPREDYAAVLDGLLPATTSPPAESPADGG